MTAVRRRRIRKRVVWTDVGSRPAQIKECRGLRERLVVGLRYENEGMDCKKLLLLFLRKLWIVLAASLAGAVIGGGVYLFYHVVLNSHREYQAESKIYLDFAPDESGEIYQEYNGYTWNDLMSTKLILDATMSFLPDSYTEEEVTAATSAQILSDLRLLTVTVTTQEPGRTAKILKATGQSLVAMGKREKEFIDIEVIKETEPKLVTVSPRLLQAALLGLMIAHLLTLFAMALFYVLDDKIYVPGDLKVITDLPFVGYSFSESDSTEHGGKASGQAAKTPDKESRLLERFREDFLKNRDYLSEKNGTLLTLEAGKNAPDAKEDYARMREADGILLSVPYGKMDRRTCAYQIEQLALQDCKPVGIIIRDADMRFMKWYHNHL